MDHFIPLYFEFLRENVDMFLAASYLKLPLECQAVLAMSTKQPVKWSHPAAALQSPAGAGSTRCVKFVASDFLLS